MGPSDHASFYRKEIPVIHVFTGTHKDYHRPSDDWDKINITDMRRVVDFITDFSDEVINADQRPQFVKVKRGGSQSAEGGRPFLGVSPDVSSAAEGLAIQAVIPDSPADKAGIQEGDVIVKFGEKDVTGLEDVQRELSKLKADATVKIVVERDGEQISLDVRLM